MLNVADRVQSVVENYNLEQQMLRDICCAVVMEDYLYGTNDKRLDIDKLVNKSDSEWSEILDEFDVYWEGHGVESDLPEVQKLRVVCDTLYLALRAKGISIDGAHLTSGMSSSVASAMGLDLTSKDYCDEDECQRVLDAICDGASDDVGDVDEVIVQLLTMQKRLKKYCNLVGLRLPKSYESLKMGLKGVVYSDDVPSDRNSLLSAITKVLFDNYCNSSVPHYLQKIITYRMNVDLLIKEQMTRTPVYLDIKQFNDYQRDRQLYNALSPFFCISNAKSALSVEGVAHFMFVLTCLRGDLLKFKIEVSKLNGGLV